MMCTRWVLLVFLGLSVLYLTALPPVSAGTERSFIGEATVTRGPGETIDQARVRAQNLAVLAALRAGANDLLGRLFPKPVVGGWYQSWDEFGTYRREIAHHIAEDRVWVKMEVGVDEPKFRAVIARNQEPPPEVVVAVAVYEEILRLPPPPDPAAETAVRQGLRTAGYQVLDQRIADSTDKRDMIRALARGDEGAARWFQEKFDADALVYGEAFAEEVRGGGRYLQFRFTGRCELHWVMLDTAREVASLSQTSVAEGESPIACGKSALAEAAKKAIGELLDIAEIGATPVQVVISKVAYFATASDIGTALRDLVGTTGRVSRPRLDLQNQTCSWDVSGPLSAFEIADGLRRLDKPRIRVNEVTGQRVVGDVVD
jgi:hypothetical protein